MWVAQVVLHAHIHVFDLDLQVVHDLCDQSAKIPLRLLLQLLGLFLKFLVCVKRFLLCRLKCLSLQFFVPLRRLLQSTLQLSAYRSSTNTFRTSTTTGDEPMFRIGMST